MNATSGGAFFQGEAFFNYKVPDFEDINDPDVCETEWQSLRMLGYAWAGPQSEYNPVGSKNPFLFGFKAWESDNPVADIGTSYTGLNTRYGACSEEPDLVRFLTTTGVDAKHVRLESIGITVYSSYPQRAADLFPLNATASITDPEAVDFQARFVEDAGDPAAESTHELRLSDSVGDTHERWIRIGFDEEMAVNGSITNSTLDLHIVGNTTMSTGKPTGPGKVECNSAVNVTFSGTFHSANSTEKPSIRQKNQPLVSFEKNDAFKGDARRAAHPSHVIGVVWIICIALLSGHLL